MNPSHLFAILRSGSHGTFRTLREGELIEACDIEFLTDSASNVSETSVGKAVLKGEAIIRLTVEK